MVEFAEVECPHCGAPFSTPVDTTEGSHTTLIDCEICCRPMTLRVESADGEIDGVWTEVA